MDDERPFETALHEVDVYTKDDVRHTAIVVPLSRAVEIVRRRFSEEYEGSVEHDRVILLEVCQSVTVGAMPDWLVGVDAGELGRIIQGRKLLLINPVRAE